MMSGKYTNDDPNERSINGERYVMFGHGHIFGDLLEIIDANQGILTTIVRNIPEPIHPTRPGLRERLERLHDRAYNRNAVNRFYPIQIQELENFTPGKQEKYIIGFSGFQMYRLVEYLRREWRLVCSSLIHPRTFVSPTATIGPGSIVQAGAIISSEVRLSEHAFINKGVKLGARTRVGKFASIGPGATVGADVRVASGCMIGIGSTIREGVTIGERSIVAAGAMVTTDVPPRSLVAGRPALVKKTDL